MGPRRASAAHGMSNNTLDFVKDGGVTDNGVKLLAELWKDEGLELYGTNWPVPTHLAHLASKRAMLHLRTAEWDRPNERTTPFYLPGVHESVRNFLYYM